MKTKKRYLTAVLGSLLGGVILSGVALAGNPHGTPPGHAKGQVQSSVSASVTANNSVGVKSSATTRFNTHAAAASNGTKAYGNGHTAGQIAEQNGAGASAVLYGPGNSQPHKTLLCSGGNGHPVEVHALKAHGMASSCVAGSATTSVPGSNGAGVVVHGKGGVSAQVHAQNHTKAELKAKLKGSLRSGVLGAQHSLSGSVTAQAKPAQAVLGTANFTG